MLHCDWTRLAAGRSTRAPASLRLDLCSAPGWWVAAGSSAEDPACHEQNEDVTV